MILFHFGNLLIITWIAITFFLINGHFCKTFPFAALLYTPNNTKITCVAAIISNFWVIDNCPEMPSFGIYYTHIMVAWNHPKYTKSYKIEKTIPHPHYYRKQFYLEDYDTSYIYPANHALFLHKSTTQIEMIPGIVQDVKIHNQTSVPRQICAVYLNDNRMLQKRLRTKDRNFCNNHFVHYFDEEQMFLDYKQFCVASQGWISPYHCCYSQALMLNCKNLMGVMAWSTSCSQQLGVDPWVITHLTSYLPWIIENIGTLN